MEGEDERRPFYDGPLWWLTKDGDLSCLELYRRHYSAKKSRRTSKQFVGPGESIVLRTAEPSAVFVWRKFIDDAIPKQEGVNCAIFRNEGPHSSSLLIRQADIIADRCWPSLRHYTYVDPPSVRSTNPGFCFQMAGWRKCGFTKGGKLILERSPGVSSSPL